MCAGPVSLRAAARLSKRVCSGRRSVHVAELVRREEHLHELLPWFERRQCGHVHTTEVLLRVPRLSGSITAGASDGLSGDELRGPKELVAVEAVADVGDEVDFVVDVGFAVVLAVEDGLADAVGFAVGFAEVLAVVLAVGEGLGDFVAAMAELPDNAMAIARKRESFLNRAPI